MRFAAPHPAAIAMKEGKWGLLGHRLSEMPHFLMMAVSSLLSASPVPLFLEGVMSVAVKRFLFWPTSCESAMAAGFARWVLGYLTSCRSVSAARVEIYANIAIAPPTCLRC